MPVLMFTLVARLARSHRVRAAARRAPSPSGVLQIVAAATALGCHHAPTYYEDVKPIFERSCVQCHQRTGVAPTPELVSFERARAAAERIRLAVQMHDMPPWGADNSGYCG